MVFESAAGLVSLLADVLPLLDRFFSDEKALHKKFDEKDLRRFRSSCSALTIAMDCNVSAETRSSHLRHAEDGFLEYVHVDPERNFGPLTGATVLTVATAGLARIYKTRGDNLLFRKYALLTFSRDPRQAREKIFPDFYRAELREECQKRVDDWYRQERTKLENKNYDKELSQPNRQSSSIAQEILIGQIDRLPWPSREWKDQAIRDIRNSPSGTNATAESLKQNSIRQMEANFRKNFAKMTDEACRDVAKQMLRDL